MERDKRDRKLANKIWNIDTTIETKVRRMVVVDGTMEAGEIDTMINET